MRNMASALGRSVRIKASGAYGKIISYSMTGSCDIQILGVSGRMVLSQRRDGYEFVTDEEYEVAKIMKS